MKKYIAPSLKVVNIESNNILAGSGGVGDGGSVGRNFNGNDVSYGRDHRGSFIDCDDED